MEVVLAISSFFNIMLIMLLFMSIRYNNEIHDYMLKQRDMIRELFKLIKDNNEFRR
jgi:hypothetical protein